ncbi:MAG: peptidylprolyl isomerase [Gallionella sp.]|nr:peptidylprolyl isomerase [Gallionella sp.]
MLNTSKLVALTLFSTLAVNTAFAEDKAAILVNGIAIPQARLDARIKAAAAQGQPDTPELRKAIRDDVINLEVLSQEATRLGLDKDSEIAQQLDIARQSVLAGAYVQNNMKEHVITDDQLKQEYDKIKATAGGKEYNVRHILVETDVDARAIIAKLNKKGNFNAIAKEKSMDTGSAAQGGELGWTVPSSFDPSFAEGMVSLKKGEYSKTPVESQYGWHIIKLDDVRDLKIPPFEEIKPQIAQRMQQQAIQEAVATLRDKAKID